MSDLIICLLRLGNGVAQQGMPAIAEQGFTWADTQHLLTIVIMTVI